MNIKASKIKNNHNDKRRPPPSSMSVRLRRKFLVWHRTIGVYSAFFTVILCVTGIALNRTVEWQLDQRQITSPLVNKWYGLSVAGTPVSYKVGNQWISFLDKTLYLDSKAIGSIDSPIRGVIQINDDILIAYENELTLYSSDGQIFDQKSANELPGIIVALGKVIGDGQPSAILLRTETGIFQTNEEMEEWNERAKDEDQSSIIWAKPLTLPSTLNTALNKQHASRGLPLSRLLLDLHTGRLFGWLGPYVMDMAAILLLFLAATGLYNWSLQRSGRP